MNVEIIQALPQEVKEQGFIATGTASWGFTPLWALVHQLYGSFVQDDRIEIEVRNLNQNGLNVLSDLHPKLILVKKERDLCRVKGLAKALAAEADQLDEDYLVVDSFRMVRGTFKINVLAEVVKGLLLYKQKRLKSSYIMLNEENYYCVKRFESSLHKLRTKSSRCIFSV